MNGPAVAAPCFNCGLSGHYQVARSNPPTCYLCKDPSHLAALCVDHPISKKLMIDDITLALNKLVVDISELKADPKAITSLDMAWILIAGLPEIVVMDELSIRKEEEVPVKTKCLESDRVRAIVHIFLNVEGYDLKISPELLNHIGHPRFFT
ncbi:hypothetical protein ZWY2020_029271 [Hordeum vulgare]|nr:hypothetical protein ZWY2020_029271 [Hordeum vulgare]